jgi:DNA-directed RNA polymerase specialized sigma24 family protein
MPRIGGKAKAVLPLTLTERVPAGTTPNPAHPLDDAIQQSNARTVDELIKSRKRVWNTKGRLRRARFRTEVEMLRLEGFSPADTAQILGVSRPSA